jgi:hypothetical protein
MLVSGVEEINGEYVLGNGGLLMLYVDSGNGSVALIGV